MKLQLEFNTLLDNHYTESEVLTLFGDYYQKTELVKRAKASGTFDFTGGNTGLGTLVNSYNATAELKMKLNGNADYPPSPQASRILSDPPSPRPRPASTFLIPAQAGHDPSSQPRPTLTSPHPSPGRTRPVSRPSSSPRHAKVPL